MCNHEIPSVVNMAENVILYMRPGTLRLYDVA